MRWRTGRRSTNVEDRRGAGGLGGLPGGVKLGGGALLLVVVAAVLLGEDPLALLSALGGGGEPAAYVPSSAPPGAAPTDEAADFIAVVLADTEDTWSAVFAEHGERYEPPRLVLYSDLVESACGLGQAAAGPFYCPPDRQVYLDLSFFQELAQLGAQGDFAAAYVLGHEVGHHVQNLVGTSEAVANAQRQASETEANALSVRLELQADCLAGVWAHHADRQRQLLEAGDVEEGLAAASAVGDDRLQKMAGRGVHPDSFTHGSSEQRVAWFRTGLETGDVDACDTFR